MKELLCILRILEKGAGESSEQVFINKEEREHGIPQDAGSVLKPLYVMYVNDLSVCGLMRLVNLLITGGFMELLMTWKGDLGC